INVNNVGSGSTTGAVTMTDTVPTGLTATALSGTGWTCALTPTVNCTRSDALAANASYPAITLAVSVAGNAPATVTNTASVAGGGETNTANDSASDPTTISAAGVPDLTVTKTHTGNFTRGGTGSYAITVNNAGSAATTGTVTMTDTLPTGLTATALSGTGWTCALTPTVNCTRSNALAANTSYPAITLSVSIANNAPATVTNTATVAGGGETNTANDNASDPTNIGTSSGPVSDNFDSTSLNTSLWTFVNPLQDGTVSLNGTNALLSVPAGQNHDAWTGGNTTPRIMQSIANVDFEVEIKFRSVVSSQYQDQGLIVEQDSQTYLRFDILQADCQTTVFAASFAGGNPTVQLNSRIRNGPNNYMRLKRSGNTWNFSYSYDGQRWTPAVTFNYTLSTNLIGPYVGNNGPNGNPAPAFTASIDYFVNRAALPSTEDGQPFVTSTAPPVISIWYGDNQTFGQHGQPQQWVNILGNASDSNGIKTLTYSLNGGPAQNLWVGENQFRLVAPGDFNAEIDYASLNPSANTVVFTAVDNLNNQTTHMVTLNYVAGQTWPLPYTITWSSVSNIQSVAQIADGMWQIQMDGTLRNTQTGYDRLITLGDRSSWKDYEVTLEATLNALDCHDFAAPAIVVGWQGHTTLQYGVPLPDQPRTGHPFPGLGWYSMENAPFARLNIWENTPTTPEHVMIQNTSGFTLSLGVKYMFKFRVQHNSIGGSHYSYKVWPSGTSEPATYNLEVDGELSQGSIVLGAHRADVSFGQVTVIGL
ncbi:MAG: hypothetical protein JWO80_3221, partial [Bryobacterales bacterium]|nr:hypothetical protein [Bryobacterales bacterium]